MLNTVHMHFLGLAPAASCGAPLAPGRPVVTVGRPGGGQLTVVIDLGATVRGRPGQCPVPGAVGATASQHTQTEPDDVQAGQQQQASATQDQTLDAHLGARAFAELGAQLRRISDQFEAERWRGPVGAPPAAATATAKRAVHHHHHQVALVTPSHSCCRRCAGELETHLSHWSNVSRANYPIDSGQVSLQHDCSL